jgi:hypothetical protein
MTVSLVSTGERAVRRGFGGRLGAEVLKLRKRRGLFWATFALVVVPVLVAYGVLAVAHAVDPARFGAAGGADDLMSSIDLLMQLLVVAATLVGITAGGADVQSGVFRELVITGRHRLELFALRVMGAVAFLTPFVVAALAFTGIASVALAGSDETPSTRLVLQSAGSLGLAALVLLLLAVGVGSALGGRVGIALVLGLHFVVTPILIQTEKLAFLTPFAALARLAPGDEADLLSVETALVVLAVCVLVPLGVGAWRTVTRDA